MASGGNKSVIATLNNFKERGVTDNTMKLSPFLKCIEACGLKEYKTNIEASVWIKHQDKAKKIPIDKIATVVIDGIAADVTMKKKKLKSPPAADDPDVQKLAADIRDKIAAREKEPAVKTKADDATTKRLTDPKGYTGASKQRFDAEGKGKGIEGREDRADNSGYVGNYKGEGTYGDS